MRRMIKVVGAALALAPLGAWAQAQLINGLGGPAGFGENQVPAGDEASAGPVDIRPAFPQGLRLLNQVRQNFFVNVNGAVSFDGGVPEWPNADLTAAPFAMAAPFWSDVDTRNGGGNIWYDLSAGQVVVTWDQVARFDRQQALRNTFQLIVDDRSDLNPGDFDIQFRYNRCEWSLADPRPGVVPARNTVRVCGNTALPINLFTDLNVVSSCVPDADTQAMLVTRTGRLNFNAANVRAYVQAGGVVITEFSSSDEVHNAVFPAEPVVQAAVRSGNCRDNINPVVRANLADPLWVELGGLPVQAANFTGCGHSVAAYPGIVALGGWDAATTSLAYRTFGAGRVWYAEGDWADGEVIQRQDPRFFNATSQAIMRYMIHGGLPQVDPTHAVAGFAAGDGSTTIPLPGSGTPQVLGLCQGSNIGQPGIWEANIRFGFFTLCGDSNLEFGEGCDDGNRVPGDGCNADCRIEDADGDGILDGNDNCPAIANAGQENNDGDAQGDACDGDDDNDTIADAADNCPLQRQPEPEQCRR
jgi:cysteine-rich repeat protein